MPHSPAIDESRRRIRELLRGAPGARVVLSARDRIDPALARALETELSSLAGRAVELQVVVDPRAAPGATLQVGTTARAVLAPGATRVESLASTGSVLQVGDGVALVSGLERVGSQEVVRFENGTEGVAFNLRDDAVGCLLLGGEEGIGEGSRVTATGRPLQVMVGDALVGRVLDALGRPIDGGLPPADTHAVPIESPSPGVVQRAPVTQSLHTGIRIIDALVPIGRGQRELVLGDRKIGKSTIAIDTILAQRGTGVVCVYAAIGQKASSLARNLALFAGHGALDWTIVVAATPGEAPGFRYVAPYSACAIGEHFMRSGRDVLVVYDDLSRHAATYREISALLERPIGREAYPGDIFYIHSRLLERAARMRDDLGGGSLTAIPIVETLAGDITALIPTNVISICDGQIVLDSGRFNEGSRPAMDVGLSVSRVGGMAQSPAMRQVAGRLRIDLAQYHEMARFVKFGAEVDDTTLQQLRRGERELEVLRQEAHAPDALEDEVVILFAAVAGLLDPVPVARIRAFDAALRAHMAASHPELLAELREGHALPEPLQQRLTQALVEFRDRFLAEHDHAAGAT